MSYRIFESPFSTSNNNNNNDNNNDNIGSGDNRISTQPSLVGPKPNNQRYVSVYEFHHAIRSVAALAGKIERCKTPNFYIVCTLKSKFDFLQSVLALQC